jgi:hypothetical protein
MASETTEPTTDPGAGAREYIADVIAARYGDPRCVDYGAADAILAVLAEAGYVIVNWEDLYCVLDALPLVGTIRWRQEQLEKPYSRLLAARPDGAR